jgi:hypothetical protein
MTLNDILTALKQPVPSEFISQKSIKGNELDFISWYHYCDLLDDRAGLGNWQWQITNTTISNNRIFLTGKLTIIGDDRAVSMDATGTEILDCNSYGDPSSNAEAMALRRCCAKFGLSRELWDKENKTNTRTANQSKSTNKPTAKGEITREQWLAMRAKQG